MNFRHRLIVYWDLAHRAGFDPDAARARQPHREHRPRCDGSSSRRQTLETHCPCQGTHPLFPSPTFAIKQHWHERYHHDPANRWLRSVVSDLSRADPLSRRA